MTTPARCRTLVRASARVRGNRTSASTSRRRASTRSRPSRPVPASITRAVRRAEPSEPPARRPPSATAPPTRKAAIDEPTPVIRMSILRMTNWMSSSSSPGVVAFRPIERPFPHRVTSVDVARRAGVSQSTVSLVFSGKGRGRVSEATQERVRRCARELGYRPNVAAQALRLGSSRAVALLVPDVTNPFFSRVLRGAQRAAKEGGYRGAFAYTPNDRRWEAQSFEALRAGPVDGYLLFEVSAPEALGPEENVVMMETEEPRRPSVRFDGGGGAAAAFQHLVELGHRRIGHLAAAFRALTFQHREQARRRVLSGAGLDPDAQA